MATDTVTAGNGRKGEGGGEGGREGGRGRGREGERGRGRESVIFYYSFSLSLSGWCAMACVTVHIQL